MPLVQVGEPAPYFTSRTRKNPSFAFDTVAGRYIVLSFLGSASDPRAARVLQDLAPHRARFDDEKFSFFGVSTDPPDEQRESMQDRIPGIRHFWDFERSVSAMYGAVDDAGKYSPVTYLLDFGLRVLAVLPLSDPQTHVATLLRLMDQLPDLPGMHAATLQAPILALPRVFEPSLCQALIAYYEAHGGGDSGFMHEVNGMTVGMMDYGRKRRRDQLIEDQSLQNECRTRVLRRLVPAIRQAFQFEATGIERYIVACYDGEERGHFLAHRDNTTKGTAHRRFAVSLFLNTGQYEGGRLMFPEFGNALYEAPEGGAVVFSCSLLHEAMPVTRGKRYMFLPFLYDEAGARVRAENRKFIVNAPPSDPPNQSRDEFNYDNLR
jgi:peroxiredoxin/predicted 2-oxoglutarate/Fe(II)-dependent dioxygenase YbiX